MHIQRNGVVYVCYDVDCTLSEGIKNMEYVKALSIVREGLPYKLASLQFCYNDVFLNKIIGPLRKICGTDVTLRSRGHFGEYCS